MGSIVGSTLGGLLGGSAGANSAPAGVNTYYPNVGQSTQAYSNLLNNQTNNISRLQDTAVPAAFNNYATASNNPFASAFQTGAGTAGNAYTNAGNNAFGAGTSVMNSSSPLQGYAQQIMQLGLDPQSNLYNQQLQSTTDTANASNAAYGLTGSYAAGNTNQAVQNFNNTWQNQQLQRAIQALGAGSGALTTAGNLDTMGNQLQTTGAGNLYTGAGLPYGTAQSIANNQNVNLNDLISNVGGINNIDSGTMASLLQYLAQASGYGINQNQAEMHNASAGASGGSQLGGMLGGLVGSFF